ncbi:MAG TPA: ATP-binding protein, partial [Myxococcales bacterium]|nr:ATP-binding protein [Myxococcales bacterium]
PGQRAADLFPAVERGRAQAAHDRVLATGEDEQFEWGARTPAGMGAWYVCTVTALREGDEVIGLLSRSSDVTALKRSEERLRQREGLMIDTQGVAHLGTWEWDVTQPHASWSDELYRIYGVTPQTYTPSYEAYLTKVHPEDRQRVIDATSRVFDEHVPYSHDERIFRPDGSVRYLHTWANPVLDEQGKLVKLIGVCQDITERKMAEEQVLELNRNLESRIAERTRAIERSLEDLEAFNATVTHDLRNPLNTIDLGCALLEREASGLQPKARDVLARIRRATSRMSDLIRDLLTLSRVGHAQLASENADLSAIASEVVANLLRSDSQRRVEVKIADGLICRGDPGLLRAALENLLGNAWKYSSKVAEARIEVGAIEGEGRRIFLVRDNGAGFEMAEAHKLFRPFERLHKAADFEGTGVGLAAVHRIVERHGGRIWAEGAPGKGATFYFELPAR